MGRAVLTLGSAVAIYLAECADGNKNTYRAKRLDLSKLASFIGEETHLRAVTQQHVQKFLNDRLSAGVAHATVRRLADHATVFFKRMRELDPKAPEIRRLSVPVRAVRAPRWLTKDEALRVFEAARNVGKGEFERLRNRLIVDLGMRCGLRVDEMVRLTVGSVDARNEILTVFGKGSRVDPVPLDAEILSYLAEYLESRRRTILRRNRHFDGYSKEQQNLFPLLVSTYKASKGDPASYRMNTKTIYEVVKRIGDAAGIRNMHPHRLRHTFGRMFYMASGYDVVKTKNAMRHQSIITTMVYLTTALDETREVQKSIWR